MGEKTIYSKPEIVFFDFKTNEIRGTTELRKEYLQKIVEVPDQTNTTEESCCIFEGRNLLYPWTANT